MNKLQKFSTTLQRFYTALFLHSAYILGIGIVSISGKLSGVYFLENKTSGSNWKLTTGSHEPDRMY